MFPKWWFNGDCSHGIPIRKKSPYKQTPDIEWLYIQPIHQESPQDRGTSTWARMSAKTGVDPVAIRL